MRRVSRRRNLWGKGAIQNPGPWHLRGIGLEGTPQTRIVVSEADLIVHVGTRMGDFATGSQSMFDNPDVKFASINVCEHDGIKQGATTVVADAKKALAALASESRVTPFPPRGRRPVRSA
jgi:3D-(3,5/4)-trihydroxycyclohexane-1,2-dione acylhydrolase (decyclizing)